MVDIIKIIQKFNLVVLGVGVIVLITGTISKVLQQRKKPPTPPSHKQK